MLNCRVAAFRGRWAISRPCTLRSDTLATWFSILPVQPRELTPALDHFKSVANISRTTKIAIPPAPLARNAPGACDQPALSCGTETVVLAVETLPAASVHCTASV